MSKHLRKSQNCPFEILVLLKYFTANILLSKHWFHGLFVWFQIIANLISSALPLGDDEMNFTCKAAAATRIELRHKNFLTFFI